MSTTSASVERVLFLVDVQNIFHGMKRATGDPSVRVDFRKLRETLMSGVQTGIFVAYVPTPVQSISRTFENECIEPGVQFISGFVNDNFVKMLISNGYKVKRFPMEMRVDATGKHQYVSTERLVSSMELEIFRWINAVDSVVIVSGAGKMIPVAQQIRNTGRKVKLACINKASDTNKVLVENVDEVIYLSTESIRYDKPLKYVKIADEQED